MIEVAIDNRGQACALFAARFGKAVQGHTQ